MATVTLDTFRFNLPQCRQDRVLQALVDNRTGAESSHKEVACSVEVRVACSVEVRVAAALATGPQGRGGVYPL